MTLLCRPGSLRGRAPASQRKASKSDPGCLLPVVHLCHPVTEARQVSVAHLSWPYSAKRYQRTASTGRAGHRDRARTSGRGCTARWRGPVPWRGGTIGRLPGGSHAPPGHPRTSGRDCSAPERFPAPRPDGTTGQLARGPHARRPPGYMRPRLCCAEACPCSAARPYYQTTLRVLRQPPPRRYMTPRLVCPRASPCAARGYHRRASSWSSGTPRPHRYMAPKLVCPASVSPFRLPLVQRHRGLVVLNDAPPVFVPLAQFRLRPGVSLLTGSTSGAGAASVPTTVTDAPVGSVRVR